MYRLVKLSSLDAKVFGTSVTSSRGISFSHLKCTRSVVNPFPVRLRISQAPDAVQSPRLAPQMVTSILRLNEVTLEECNGAVKGLEVNQLQANKPIEDRYAYGKLVHGRGMLFGVFDGHAGSACAQAVSDRLFNYIAVAMADHDVLHNIREGKIDPTTDLLQRGKQAFLSVNSHLAGLHRKRLVHFAVESMAIDSSDNLSKDSLVSAFLRLDKDIITEAMPSMQKQDGLDNICYNEALSIAFSGAVACVGFVDGKDLFVANVGDSRAVLGVHNDNRWEAVPLSKTHDAGNTAELERLFRSHPNESSNIIRNHRLLGELIPLRSFGDCRYKWSKSDLKHLLNTRQFNSSIFQMYGDNLIPKNSQTPPYLDAEPEVVHHHLTPKDKFLVLATDGLWDCLSPEKVVQLVAGHMDGKQVLVNYDPPKNAKLKAINQVLAQRKSSLLNRTLDANVATHLLRSALGPEHGLVSAQLTLPDSLARFYRDDITVIVVYFDSDYLKDHAVM
ncbi:hypothetical protein C0Q70_18752 [Pomacea canaliculata]|uniref:PPM-type phosphatase domain-containing protein n=2 Tax=Pomacea canaliculata TaxID=400727 RepID=A0A2T7NHG6_POMCA|nr:hypothetical protein C0Q70_18752 [Pomacea canaliculata]